MGKSIDVKLLEDLVESVIELDSQEQQELLGKIAAKGMKRKLQERGLTDIQISKRFEDMGKMLEAIDKMNDEQKEILTDYVTDNIDPDFRQKLNGKSDVEIEVRLRNYIK